MAPNKHKPYAYVLPEDDANRQMAVGFRVEIDAWQMKILTEAGGWQEVFKLFTKIHLKEMDADVNQHMILLFDFDGQLERLQEVKKIIPERLSDRVFVLGVLTEPEELKKAGLGHYGEIGKALAIDCRDGTDHMWNHDLLRHNAGEVNRLRERVRPMLF